MASMDRDGMKHRDGRPEMSGYNVYEQENDRLTESLRLKANALKSVSVTPPGRRTPERRGTLDFISHHAPHTSTGRERLRGMLGN